jgi:hypothetical protein
MAKVRLDKPGVTTFTDHEVIVTPNQLRKAVQKVGFMLANDDPVARAEAALAQLSSEFTTWMYSECDRLDAARREIKESGLDKKNVDALYHAAHDIKGEADTFGYPAVVDRSACGRHPRHHPRIRAARRRTDRVGADEKAARRNGRISHRRQPAPAGLSAEHSQPADRAGRAIVLTIYAIFARSNGPYATSRSS